MPQAPEQRPAVERVKPPEAMIRIANPVFNRILRSPLLHGLVDEHLLLLHFRGRRTRRAYTVVAGYRDIDGRPGVLTNSGWRFNFRGGAEVGVTLKGERRRGPAGHQDQPRASTHARGTGRPRPANRSLAAHPRPRRRRGKLTVTVVFPVCPSSRNPVFGGRPLFCAPRFVTFLPPLEHPEHDKAERGECK